MPSRCEDCALKAPSFGLPAEGRKRWCSGCAKAHAGAQSFESQRKRGAAQTDPGDPPAPKHRRVTRLKNASCEICWERTAESVESTPCGHDFHASCIAAWHSENSQHDRKDCPKCRGVYGRLSALRRRLRTAQARS